MTTSDFVALTEAKTTGQAPFKLALFGSPVHHSLSPLIHQHFARQYGISLEYALREPAENQFRQALTDFFQNGGHGANITVPYKQLTARWMDELGVNELAESARRSEAVNTLVRRPDGQLVGYNTDGAGLLRDLRDRHRLGLTARRILIIGAGGAARGVVPALLTAHPVALVVANRGQQRLQTIQRLFPEIEAVPLQDLASCPAFDIIINATSLGHQGCSPLLPETLLRDKTVAYDLSYGAAARAFMEAAQKAGACQVLDGLGMLVEQAALAFELWFGHLPETESIYRQLRNRTAQKD